MDFTKKLPFHVLCMIFSHSLLGDDDSIEFRKVCKSWRTGVPKWSQARFTGVHFEGDERTPFELLYPFLGPHTRNVSLTTLPCDTWDDEPDIVLDVLQNLIDRGCTQIETLWFNYCSFSDNTRFMSQMALLGHKVYSLTFTKHGNNLAFYDIIKRCPQLTHFAFSTTPDKDVDLYEAFNGDPGWVESRPFEFLEDYDSEDEDAQERRSVDEDYEDGDNDIMFPNLVCLSIDLIMLFKKRLAPIVKRAPNLRVLRIGNIDIYEYPYDIERYKTTNIERVFQWCPLLECVEYNDMHPDTFEDVFDFPYWSHRAPLIPNAIENGNLRHLLYYEPIEYKSTAIVDQILKNQQWLELLRVGCNSHTRVEWDRIGSVKAMSHLRRLDFDGIKCHEQPIASVIRASPAVEELLVNIETDNGRGYEPVFDAIKTLSKLRDLKINYKSNRFQPAEGDPNPPNDQQLIPACNFFNTVNAPLQKLMVKGDWALLLNYTFLSAVASITTLEELELHPGGTVATAEEVVLFVQQLKQTKLRQLNISAFDTLSPEVFHVMAELQYLSTLRLEFCRPVASRDLIVTMRNSKSLSSITIEGFSDPGGPEEAFAYVKNQLRGSVFKLNYQGFTLYWGYGRP